MDVGKNVVEWLGLFPFNLNVCEWHFVVVTGVVVFLEKKTFDALVQISMRTLVEFNTSWSFG